MATTRPISPIQRRIAALYAAASAADYLQETLALFPVALGASGRPVTREWRSRCATVTEWCLEMLDAAGGSSAAMETFIDALLERLHERLAPLAAAERRTDLEPAFLAFLVFTVEGVAGEDPSLRDDATFGLARAAREELSHAYGIELAQGGRAVDLGRDLATAWHAWSKEVA